MDALGDAEKTHGTQGNAIFYLAVADRFFGIAVEQLGKAKLTDQGEDKNGKLQFWRRVVIEKPFGHSLDSARQLNARILRTLHEDQIFRIDHFLGKDTVQSIMAFRFANGLFEPIWNRDRIDHVQITVAETVGVEERGKFYEQTGALRDMVPNHVFTLLSMVAMEPPTGFDAASIRTKKAEVFAAMPAVKPAQAVRGQYGAGTVLGKQVNAYRNEPNVAADSNIETYVAMQLEIDNWRWAGVPFYFRTGKHMSQRLTEIAIRFKQAPYTAFQDTAVDALRPNWLVLSIAPDEGISLQFEVKRRGPVVDLAAVKMDFHYDDWFPKEPNVGYETLIYDVMIGDATLFMRADMVEQSWRIVQPVLDAWAAEKTDFPDYNSGSDGPKAADELLARDGEPVVEATDFSIGAKAMTAQHDIRLFLADVDGALVTKDKVLTEAAKAAVRELDQAGIAFAITSGRPPRGMSMLIEPLAIADRDSRLQWWRAGQSRSLRDRKPHARSGCSQADREAHPGSGAGRLGLHGDGVADPRQGCAACGARGLDGEIRRQGRGVVHGRPLGARGEDRWHLRRSRPCRRLRESGAGRAGGKGECCALAALLSRRDSPASQQGDGRRNPLEAFEHLA